ncbi:PPA1309 family protein [Nocardioides jiangxiensis]|uniref:PPA1309 family protein n=1 Tax=Nocardioides jiangxiensis TaxID=3064524 RepID=A0ABT9AYC1_9ACTN|nr:PPA1309 family protein [Nocardioides sp. WY-20]MDO7867415.1 PPA1309 family protein [Nocardioides sp. WY-20]
MTELSDPAFDPALAAAVVEIEEHAAETGWDGQARLFALVDTSALVAREPALAAALGLDAHDADGSLTPIEQDLEPGQQLEQVLEQIGWPPEVAGCAAVVERLVLPPAAEGQVPEGLEEAQAFAADHPDRQEVRIVAGVTRRGGAWCTLRLRAHDNTDDVIGGVDLVPALLALLGATLEDEA